MRLLQFHAGAHATSSLVLECILLVNQREEYRWMRCASRMAALSEGKEQSSSTAQEKEGNWAKK